jgi:hypothetical protein
MGCCLLALASWLSPRLGIFVAWVFFNDRTSAAFSSFILPFLGFLFLPWTTLAYIVAWAPIGAVSGFGWFLVIFAFLVDLGSYTSGARARQRRSAAAY